MRFDDNSLAALNLLDSSVGFGYISTFEVACVILDGFSSKPAIVQEPGFFVAVKYPCELGTTCVGCLDPVKNADFMKSTACCDSVYSNSIGTPTEPNINQGYNFAIVNYEGSVIAMNNASFVSMLRSDCSANNTG